jgi:hypothetical protein
MRKATLFIISILLAAPAAAYAKGGVEFNGYPDSSSPGKPISFTVIAYRDPPASGGVGRAIVGVHPLVTFRSKSGRVIRVRASKTNVDGIAHGSVTFGDHGPWTTELHAGSLRLGPEMSEPIHVGIGLTQTIPAADSQRPKTVSAPEQASSFPWVWVLSLASIGAALLVLLMRRRGHWGAA